MITSNIKVCILNTPRKAKRFFVLCIDLTLSIISVWLAFYLRVDEFIPVWEQRNEHFPLPACIAALLISTLIFNYFNFYKVIFRYFGSQEMINILKASLIYGIIYSIIFTIIRVEGVPRTIGIIQPLVFFLLICSSRFFVTSYLEDIDENKSIKEKKTQAIIYGAGNRGYQLSRSLSQNSRINIVGFFDDDSSFHGSKINNFDIFNPKEIDTLIASKNISEIIFAFDNKNNDNFKKAIGKLEDKNLRLRILSSYDDLLINNRNLNNIRKLSIEDILGREPILPDPNLMKRDTANKVVLVSGAGGSIGSQLCKEVLMQTPKKLILLDHSEFALYNIFQELKNLCVNDTIDIIPILGSVTEVNFLEHLFKKFNPQSIFHAAAYKHVSLVEENIIEGINNNVFGTLNLASIAIKNNVEKFVLISTDKAVRPTSIMGASKKIAEMILQALSINQKETIFAIVRFGNVLGSSGSVVPLFSSQIKKGGPVTVTHPEVARYFMTVKEAAQLVIQASAMTDKVINQSKTAPIFLLKMGPPIKIIDLAKLMIKLSNLTINSKNNRGDGIKIKITGLRPGEKLKEELLIGDAFIDSMHPKIGYTNEIFIEWHEMEKTILRMKKLITEKNDKDIKNLIFEVVS
ncbi:polysaccharide biosynthesis protein [Alphaproteobacteria bacterium]|nr:polysaccharide biosynthesis protein [Alphaproteobacteria bacterium]